MKELVGFVGWSHTTAAFAIQRYYSELGRVLEECAKKPQRVDVLREWLCVGLEDQLTRMLGERMSVATNFISKLTKLFAGLPLEQLRHVALEKFAKELCLKFVM